MTVVARKRGHRTTHYVVVTWRGKRIWENVGADKREAQRLDKRRRAEVKDDTYVPPKRRGQTVARYAETWLASRRSRSVDAERHYLEQHVLVREWFAGLKMEDVRGSHIAKLVAELKAVVSRRRLPEGVKAKPIAPKTVANIYGVVRTMFREAAAREDIDRDPCALPKGTIVRGARQRREPYKPADVRTLLTCASVPTARRMFAALALLTGMREGEVCGRRWKDWDRDAEPLGSLTVDSQYDGRPLKTDKECDEHPRIVPVHPALAALLTAWWDEGYELAYLRKPTPDDYIVPCRDGHNPHTRSSAYKAWRAGLAKAGVPNLSLHSTRHTFVSMCRRGGAPKDVVERITHNAGGDIVDRYTHFDWAPLCAAVLCLPLGATVDANVDAIGTVSSSEVEALGIEPGGVGGNRRRLLGTGGGYTPPATSETPHDSAAPPPIVARVYGGGPAPWVHEATANLYELLAARGAS